MTDGLFHCEDCDNVLEENDNAENVKYSQEVLARYDCVGLKSSAVLNDQTVAKCWIHRLREQCLPIISLLKQTDSLVIPARYVIWIHKQFCEPFPITHLTNVIAIS